MSLCQKHQIHFISDEVYALSVFETGEPNTVPFTSVLSINPTGLIDPNLVHVTYALSKDFGSPGLRIGALITKNKELKNSLIATVRFHSTAGPSIAIATAMLEDRECTKYFLATSRQRLSQTYKHVTSKLGALGVEYLAGGNAGFFVWINLSPFLPPQKEGLSNKEREQALAQKFLDGGVFLHPGEEHSLSPGWFRMVYSAVGRNVLDEGLRRYACISTWSRLFFTNKYRIEVVLSSI